MEFHGAKTINFRYAHFLNIFNYLWDMALNAKQKLFCEEYMKDLNATQAAIRSGYSEDTAGSIGSENLKKPEIQSYVTELQTKASQRNNLSLDRVLNEYAKIAFFDIRKAYGEDGGLKSLHDLDDDTAGAIAGVESYEEKTEAGEETITAGTVRKIKVWDKKNALDSICKVLGYNAPEKTDNTHTISATVIPAKLQQHIDKSLDEAI